MDKRSFDEGFRRAFGDSDFGDTEVELKETAWAQWVNEAGFDGSSKLTTIEPSPDELQFRLVVKFKNEVMLDILGFPKSLRAITAKDMADAFEAERIIEKLIGLRVHILQIAG